MTRTPKDAKPMPDGAELLRLLRMDAQEFRDFLDGLEEAMGESLKSDPPKKRAPKAKPKG